MITIAKVQQFYETADAAHNFDHVLRVLRLAERIGQAEEADMEIVRAAALLHDVGRETAEAIRMDHAIFAAARAREILVEQPATIVEAVTHAIAAHRFRTSPQPATLEAQVLFDADKLDAIGAIGVARAFTYGGTQEQRLWAPVESVDVTRWMVEGDDPQDHTPVHEFVVKLSRLKEHLFTPIGRSIAQGRHDFMVAFFEQLDAEVRGER